ncbi:hypothetical protein HRE53_01140 [Acaryochloris sp. 'Moss Beach']|uniref:hypothetical protein n=1 Tax=Acaryochloris sp. 'Moss Beach' TaxID=2740837 RepID=UPI001F2FDDC4|nr:hypothetical protein [Acaryochloris sp. 'Moss Beach']UJB69832.1 hypothetical protein HRE53_01140 [Acaryochloris sp. 'Moss Beach']
MSHMNIKRIVVGCMGAISTTITLYTTPISANELTEVLADTPMQLQLKTLDRSWQRLSLNQESLGPAMLFGISGALQSSLRTNIYYTQGQTITLGKQKYLVAYRPESSTLTELLKSNRNRPPESFFKVLTPNTQLFLSLINLAKIDSLQGIQPFDLQKEIRESKEAIPEDTKSKDKPKVSPEPTQPSSKSK